MIKKLFLIPLAIFLILGFWWLKPFIDINNIGFSEAPTATPIVQKLLLKFSVIGDPESDLKNLKKALEKSKTNGDEFAILVGDLTQVGSEQQLFEIKKVLEEGNLQYFVIPGNHDLYSARKQTDEPLNYYIEVFGKPYDYLLKEVAGKKIGFLLLDNSDENLGMKQEQIEFIEKTLASKRPDLNFVFLHIPIYHPSSDYIMGYSSQKAGEQKEELLTAFKQASVSAVFTGHLHKTASYELEKIKMYVAGSVNSLRNWQTPRYLEVEVFENNQFSVKEIEL